MRGNLQGDRGKQTVPIHDLPVHAVGLGRNILIIVLK